MTESWLLFDEAAIRQAAGKPNGRVGLKIPRDYEAIADAKTLLHVSILEASELSGRRRQMLQRSVGQRVHRIAELIDDYSALDGVVSFAAFRSDLRAALAGLDRPSDP